MTTVTQILAKIEEGDPSAAEYLLPLVYNELRKLAAAKLGKKSRDKLFKRQRECMKLTCGLSIASKCNTGILADTSLRPRPNRCAGSW